MKYVILSIGLLLATGVALADSSWDTNSDGMIDREEFRAGLRENAFGTWDTDNDGMLSREEYEVGISGQDNADSFSTWDDRYGEWDTDQDEMLSLDEYDEGLWGALDSDNNEIFNEEEAAAWEANDPWKDEDWIEIGNPAEICRRYPERDFCKDPE